MDDLDAWLALLGAPPETRESQWGPSRLAHWLYVTRSPPPDHLTTSVRGVLFKGARVMVVRDSEPSHHVMPGGRREPGEDEIMTLHREIAEETGWTIASATPLGFLHFRHQTAKPADYRYPYPDFFQRLYVLEAGDFDRRRVLRDGWEESSRMMSVARAHAIVRTDQTALLASAIRLRRDGRSKGLTSVSPVAIWR